MSVVHDLAEGVFSGQRRQIARAITLVESMKVADRGQARELLGILHERPTQAVRVGVSGVPGAGKSRTRRGGKSAAAATEVAAGVEGDAAAAEATKSAAKKPAAKKAAPANKPKAAPAPRAAKTSGSKASTGRSVATKKG